MILFLIMWQLYRKKQLNKLLFFYLMHVGGSWSTWDEGRTYSAPNRTAMQRCSPIAPTAAQIITESIYYRSYSCCETSGVVTQTIRSRWLQWDSNKRVVWSASICLHINSDIAKSQPAVTGVDFRSPFQWRFLSNVWPLFVQGRTSSSAWRYDQNFISWDSSFYIPIRYTSRYSTFWVNSFNYHPKYILGCFYIT